MQSGGVTDKEAASAELDLLRSMWREAMLAAREALLAEKGVLPPDELAAHERHLRDEYEKAMAGLRQFARDEGLPAELARPFLPLRRAGYGATSASGDQHHSETLGASSP
jgi:hypothetical protein